MWKILVFWKTLAVYSRIVFRNSLICPLHESICCFSGLKKKQTFLDAFEPGHRHLPEVWGHKDSCWLRSGNPRAMGLQVFLMIWMRKGRNWCWKENMKKHPLIHWGCFGPCHLQVKGLTLASKLYCLSWTADLWSGSFWSQDCRYQKPPNNRMVVNNEMNYQAQRVRISFFRITRCSGSRLGNLLLPNLLAAKGLWASWHA